MAGNFLERGADKIAIDEKIAIDIYSPFFDSSEVKLSKAGKINPRGPVVQPFTKLSNGDIARMIGHIDKFQFKNQPSESKGWRLISDGMHIDTGNIGVTRIDSNRNNGSAKYSFNFFSGNTDNLLSAIGEKTLRDLAMDGVRTIEGGDIYGTRTFEYGAPPGSYWYWISVWGWIGTEYGEGDPDPAPIPLFDWLNGNGPSTGGAIDTWVAKDIDDEYSFALDIFADLGTDVHAATALYCTGIVNAGDDYICFPTIKVFTGDKNDTGEPLHRIINRWNTGEERFSTYISTVNEPIPGWLFTLYEETDNSLVPMYYYHKVLRHIFSEHGYTLNNDWLLEDTQFLKMALVNTHRIQRPTMVYMDHIHSLAEPPGYSGNTLYYEQTTEINPANHLPELSIVDFLRDFMMKFCCYFEVKGNEVTIVHQDVGNVQREIKVISPEDIIEIMPETGLHLKYELDNASYAVEKAITKAYSDLPDDSELADLADNDWYVDRYYNFIYKKLAGDDKFIGSNLIGHNAGKRQEYTMPLSPVNCANTPYADLFYAIDDGIRLFIPFINSGITGYSTKVYNFTAVDYADDASHRIETVPTEEWIFFIRYNLSFAEGGELTEADSIKQVGFYHGVMGIALIYEFPYMSFHNYLPGEVPVKLGDWHLGIIGTEGLIETFYGSFASIFSGRKFTLACAESLYDIKKHKHNQSVVCNGTKLYIGNVKLHLPLHGRFPIYECWEVS